MDTPIETARLIIRRFVLDDLPDIHRILNAAFPEDAVTLDQREEWLRWSVINDVQLERLHQPPYGDRVVVLKASSQLIGSVGLVPAIIPAAQLTYFNPTPTPHAFHRPAGRPYYPFDPAYHRQGYGTVIQPDFWPVQGVGRRCGVEVRQLRRRDNRRDEA